jgi:hypothetical protein
MRPGQFKAFLSFILLFCIASGGANTGVLCFGLDGHAEIELGQCLSCSHAIKLSATAHFQEPLDSRFNARPAGDACSPCIDVPLSITGAFSHPASFQSQLNCQRILAFYPMPLLNHSNPTVVIARDFSPKEANRSPFALTILSAVIILV